MSSMSLEERRAERRRRREMETESMLTKTPDEVEADLQERLAQRRKERDERMAAISSNLVAVNGEDDLERRRRERREARLRGNSTDDASVSSYRSRRRDTEEEPTEDSFSSYRSRRRRNWDDDEETPTVNETPSVPDTSAEESAAERRRRQREEEEEEARRQQEREEEEQRREAELEERRRQEEEERRREREEEDRRRQEEEERRRQEEEEERQRQKRDEEQQFDDASEDASDEEYDRGAENKLYIDEDALKDSNTRTDILNSKVEVSEKLDRVRKWNEDSNNIEKGDRKETVGGSFGKENRKSCSEVDTGSKVLGRSSSFKEINNNKIKDKLEKFEHLKDVKSDKRHTGTTITAAGKSVSQNKEGLKEKLQKFEQEKAGQSKVKSQKQLPGYTPPAKKLSDKLQHFETAARTQSATKASSRNIQKPGPVKEPPPSKKVLDRWKSVEKQENNSVKSSPSKEESSRKRLSGNVEFVTARYLEKASKSIDESALPKSPKSPAVSQQNHVVVHNNVRNTSQSSGNQSEFSENLSPNQSRSKVTDRWQFGAEADKCNSQGVGQGSSVVHSRGSSMDNSYIHSRGSSFDASSEKSWKHSQQDQEEEDRLEAARQEKLRMAEESKKRGKKKGLGGLTPEKKKKLKDFVVVDYDTEEEEEKARALSERIPPLPDDIDYFSTAELRKLCKQLHARLAEINSDVYDWEYKVGKQEQEITELTMKVNDAKGKFVKPVLRKVNKKEQKF